MVSKSSVPVQGTEAGAETPLPEAQIATVFEGGFFQNKQRAFWILQTSGWLGYGVIRFFNGLARNYTFEYWKPSFVALVAGFLITLVYRPILKRIWTRSTSVVMFTVAVTSIFFALIFSAIETVGHVLTYEIGWQPRFLELFGNTILDVYVLLSWAALYLIINYSLMMQNEREKTLKATSMAHQAQLKMLRYQLNPHFLFNTLNAISTLVLSKKYNKANTMLGKLSSFLRYSLVHQPTQKTTLDEELQALRLYLDIEKVRFQKRLKLEYKIDPKARDALMPSLLLQPLIENAIKFAIAPAEQGGKIMISADCTAEKLSLKVRDDGPGIGKGNKQDESQSAGVGIANIKARLEQLYGQEQSFILKNVKPRGLEAEIIIPCEFAEKKR